MKKLKTEVLVLGEEDLFPHSLSLLERVSEKIECSIELIGIVDFKDKEAIRKASFAIFVYKGKSKIIKSRWVL